ncbi:MAG: hypothetical protein JW782_05310 [Candidatus Saganbacteria bacterium]|nr:hypothetical protein [Candidatus Saganbacteria bacterium]
MAQQVSRDVNYRGRALAIEVRGRNECGTRAIDVIRKFEEFSAVKDIDVRFFTPLGVELNAASMIGKSVGQIDALAAEIDKSSQAAAAREFTIELPGMIPISDEVSIMNDLVTIGLFREVMKGVEIKGDGAKELQELLSRSESGHEISRVSLLDARQFANRLSAMSGGKFRVPTLTELEQVKGLIPGRGMYCWTETVEKGKYRRYDLTNGDCGRGGGPQHRYITTSIILVQDVGA